MAAGRFSLPFSETYLIIDTEMTILEYTEQLLRSDGNQQFLLEADDLAICIYASGDYIYSFLAADKNNKPTLQKSSNLKEALSFWVFNLERLSGLTIFDKRVRQMKRHLFDWL